MLLGKHWDAFNINKNASIYKQFLAGRHIPAYNEI